jgi:hypothetical protein
MEYVGKFKEFNPRHDFPSMRDSFEDSPYEGMDKIVYYLKHGTIDCAAIEIPHDVFSGDIIPMEKLGMNDGKYTWFNILAYYVEKYNLRLPKDFENHVLAK